MFLLYALLKKEKNPNHLLVTAIMLRGKQATPIARGAGGDSMDASLLNNPLYNNTASMESPLYNYMT